MRKLWLLALLVCARPAAAQHRALADGLMLTPAVVGVWRHAPVAEIWSTTVLLGDWMTTLDMRGRAGYKELNPWLGAHPSTATINHYSIAMLALNTLVVPLAPKGVRNAAWWFVAGFETYLLQHQWRIGLRLSARF